MDDTYRQAHVIDADGRTWHPGEDGRYSAARDEAARSDEDDAGGH